MKKIYLPAVVAAAALISGCAAPGSCDTGRDYVAVEPTPKIETGADMDPLPPGEELTIPVASTPPGVGEGCLERPPNYFDRPIGSTAASDGDGG